MAGVVRPRDRTKKILSFWTAKGGVGASVTAAATALLAGREHGEALLVDLRGDQAAILGLSTPTSAGVNDWLGSRADRRESIEGLCIPTSAGVHLVPPGGDRGWNPARVEQLVEVLGSFDCPVIVDCGIRTPQSRSVDDPDRSRVEDLVDAVCSASRSVLVSSSCYLAVRRAVHVLAADDRDLQDDRDPQEVGDLGDSTTSGRPLGGVAGRTTRRRRRSRTSTSGLVVVADPGRALDASDVASVTQLDLLASVERDPAVARCVDAGQFLTRPPRSLLRALRGVL